MWKILDINYNHFYHTGKSQVLAGAWYVFSPSKPHSRTLWNIIGEHKHSLSTWNWVHCQTRSSMTDGFKNLCYKTKPSFSEGFAEKCQNFRWICEYFVIIFIMSSAILQSLQSKKVYVKCEMWNVVIKYKKIVCEGPIISKVEIIYLLIFTCLQIFHSFSWNDTGNYIKDCIDIISIYLYLCIYLSISELAELLGITHRGYCMENWSDVHGRCWVTNHNHYPLSMYHFDCRLYYSITVLCMQFLLPSTLLLLAHIRIYRKLASLPFWGQIRCVL